MQILFFPPPELRNILPFAILFLIPQISFAFRAWTRSITFKLLQKRFLVKGSVPWLQEGFHWNTLVEDICFPCFSSTCKSLRGFFKSLHRSARSSLDSGNQAAFPCDTKKMSFAVTLVFALFNPISTSHLAKAKQNFIIIIIMIIISYFNLSRAEFNFTAILLRALHI